MNANANKVNKSIAISLKDVCKTYYPLFPWQKSRGVTALRGLNLEVERGTIQTLLGPNGAGKTTTVKIIAGLILPTSGQITFYGNDGVRLRERPRIGAVLEGTRNIYFRLSPLENLYYFGELKGLSTVEIRRQSKELLEEFRLADRARSSVQTLSRGMQQKVAISVALLGDPEILLLDEPTLGLDVESALLIRNKLKTLVNKKGKTIVLTTHQMDLAASISDSVAIIQEGALLVQDSTVNLIDYFKRADFELELSRSDWERVVGDFYSTRFTLEEMSENDLVKVTFHLKNTQEFYVIAYRLAEAKIAFRSLRQVSPTLEEVFLEITRLHKRGATFIERADTNEKENAPASTSMPEAVDKSALRQETKNSTEDKKG